MAACRKGGGQLFLTRKIYKKPSKPQFIGVSGKIILGEGTLFWHSEKISAPINNGGVVTECKFELGVAVSPAGRIFLAGGGAVFPNL